MEKHMSKVEILIRQFKLSDLDELYKVLSDPEVMQYIEPPYSLKQTRTFLIDA